MKKDTIFCSICMKDVPVKREIREEDIKVRGIPVHVRLTYIVDPAGHELFDYDIETANFGIIDTAYRKAIGFLTRQEIRNIRAKYGLSAELFSKALGMGLKSITRLENDFVQSRETNSLLRLVQKPENFLEIINFNRSKLTEKEYQRCLNGYYKANPITFGDNDLYQDWYEGITQLLGKNLVEIWGKDEKRYLDGVSYSTFYPYVSTI